MTLIATGEEVGSFIAMPDGRMVLGFLTLLTIPFVWLGHWLS